jgi:hypothetical protein
MSISPINLGQLKLYAENFSVNVAATSVNTVVAQYIVPSKCRFRLRDLGNYIGTVAAWGFIVWHLNCNGIPCAPYGAFMDQIGYAAQRQEVEHLEFGGGSILTVTADNPTAAIVAVGISLSWELIFQE